MGGRLEDVSEEIRAGAPSFDDVYQAHVDRVARWAIRLGGPAIDVDDVVQEVFVAVHRQLAGFRGDSSVATWLYRITANVVSDRRRRNRWRRFLSGHASDYADRVPSGAPTPIEVLEQREAVERVYRALDGMNERYRTLIILFEIEQLSGQEVVRLTGTKEGTLFVTLHRARAQFKKRLSRIEREEDRT